MSFIHDHDLGALRLIEPRDVQFKMYVTPRFEWHYISNAYEPYTARLLGKMCERASLFVDVGAHYGFFSLQAASRHPGLNVIAVEPAKSNFDILNRNILLNHIPNVQTHNVAISDAEGVKPFHVFEASDNCGLHLHPQARLLRTETVRTTTIDAILSGVQVGPIVIKIDVEGHEVALLAGMKQTLERFQDIALFVEFNPKMLKAAGEDPSAFLREVDELGFAIFLLDDDNQRHFRIRRETNWSDFMKQQGYANLICVPKSKALSALFVSHSSGMGGAERSLLELVDELIADYWTLATVVCPAEGALPKALRGIGAAVCILPYRWWGSVGETYPSETIIAEDTRSILRWLPLFRSVDPDVVWTQSIVIPWGAVMALLIGKRHIWSICEYGEKDHNIRFFLPFPEVLKFVEFSSDFVFTGSPSLLGELWSDLPSEKADYLFRHVPVPKKRRSAGRKIWRTPGAIRMAIFGSIQEGKGQEDLVRAVARVKKVELVIAGADSGDGYLASLQSLIDELGVSEYVTFIGFVDDPFTIMASADIVVSCSRFEAFGRTVIEAMLLGRAVIYSRAGSHPDYMLDGVTGLSYAPGNVDELVGCIEALGSSSLRKSLGDKAKAYAVELFTKDGYGGKVHRRLVQFRDSRPRRTTDMRYASNLLYAGLDSLGSSHPSANAAGESEHLRSAFLDPVQQAEKTEVEQRKLVAEINNRDAQLVALNDELVRVVARADSDLRRLMGDVEGRDQRLAAADEELHRMVAELDGRDQRLVAANDELVRIIAEADGDLRRALAEVRDRDQRLAVADEELRRTFAELDGRDQRLVATNDELVRVVAQADSDLRRALAEVRDRDRRLAAADDELRRMVAELDGRDQRLVATNDELVRVVAQADSELRRSLADVRDRDQRLVAMNDELVRVVAQADSDLRRSLADVGDRDQRLAAADEHLRRMVAELDGRDQRLVAMNDELVRVVGQADSDLRRSLADVGDRDQRLVAMNDELLSVIAVTDQKLDLSQSALEESGRQLVLVKDALDIVTDQLADRDRRLVVANEELRRASGRADQAVATADGRVRQLIAARQELRDLTDKMEEREQRLAVLGRRLEELEISATWRITARLQKFLADCRQLLSGSRK